MKRRQFLTAVGVGGVGAVAGSVTGRLSANATADNAGYAGTQTGSTQVVWSVATDQLVAALTFDDGPNPLFTERVLQALANHRLVATFFMVGANVERHPDLARAVAKAGHEIGNHSQNHLNLMEHSASVVADEVNQGSKTITTVTGVTPGWFRAPRGRLSGAAIAAAASANLGIAMWSTNRGGPWVPDGDASAVAAQLTSTLHPGAIFDLHDGMDASDDGRLSLRTRRDAEIRALDRFLTDAAKANYRFVTLSELVALGNATPAPARAGSIAAT
ncbi:MAG: chitooligosaccharide deacetylase [Acidimicrobiia bacterium]|nr:chitooligosaccharide deacetylase [Acidimicrobiia bacterium]